MSNIRIYIAIWGVLVLLTILEVMMVAFEMAQFLLILGVLGIAAVKAIYIALYYQHLKFDDEALSWFYMMALFFAILIAIVWSNGGQIWSV